MSKLEILIKDIQDFYKKIDNGDKYLTSKPKKEKGLHLDLFRYLMDLGYLVVYELELPNLQQYLVQELNESYRDFSYEEGSLRPDIVVYLEEEGYVCLELKYNESDRKFSIDGIKSRIYVEHCLDVHYAGYINLHKNSLKQYDADPCKDEIYRYSFYYKCDQTLEKSGKEKSKTAYSIKLLWAQKALDILDGKGEFSEYGY